MHFTGEKNFIKKLKKFIKQKFYKISYNFIYKVKNRVKLPF